MAEPGDIFRQFLLPVTEEKIDGLIKTLTPEQIKEALDFYHSILAYMKQIDPENEQCYKTGGLGDH